MPNIRKILFLLLMLSQIQLAYGSPFGITYTQLLIPKDPDNLHGFKLAFVYQPECLLWPRNQILFDASVGHWYVPGLKTNRSLNIFSLNPIFRFYLTRKWFISPFLDLNLGLAYLTRTRIAERNLGMHFAFQDQIAIGAVIGRQQQLAISASIIHYSNGSLCDHNSGITIPLLINLSYRF